MRICNTSTRSLTVVGVGGMFAFAGISCEFLASCHRCLYCATGRACPHTSFSMTTELLEGVKSSSLGHEDKVLKSVLERPMLTTKQYKQPTSELCNRTKECRLTSQHKCHLGTILIMVQISRAILSPKLTMC